MKLNKDIYKMDFEKVNIQELYYSCESKYEKIIVEIIRIAQKQLREKQKRIDNALSYIYDNTHGEEDDKALILCDDEIDELKDILRG